MYADEGNVIRRGAQRGEVNGGGPGGVRDVLAVGNHILLRLVNVVLRGPCRARLAPLCRTSVFITIRLGAQHAALFANVGLAKFAAVVLHRAGGRKAPASILFNTALVFAGTFLVEACLLEGALIPANDDSIGSHLEDTVGELYTRKGLKALVGGGLAEGIGRSEAIEAIVCQVRQSDLGGGDGRRRRHGRGSGRHGGQGHHHVGMLVEVCHGRVGKGRRGGRLIDGGSVRLLLSTARCLLVLGLRLGVIRLEDGRESGRSSGSVWHGYVGRDHVSVKRGRRGGPRRRPSSSGVDAFHTLGRRGWLSKRYGVGSRLLRCGNGGDSGGGSGRRVGRDGGFWRGA
ncbi:hypothetical protein G6O67_008628 [Ophiocordyceps sinensis]|uniref:Uncharacterized protein n=1 Tax=Ophiocordyceps sinensis TaxID=72228 RepID=A0A8H4LQI5_9HYPO|nr:hypothetical protein G6O67_008628 [Ophiocordyceps sinensis]